MKPVPEQILVKTEDTEFLQDVVIPKFCNHCNVVDHLVLEYNKTRAELGKEKGSTRTKTQNQR